MSYTNSALATLFIYSPHFSERFGDISKITVHHAAAIASAKEICNHFQSKSIKASANYVIGKDGEIALCVPEKCRAWTSNNAANDNMAVTIEVANSTGAPSWEVSFAAWASLVNLCIDICRRNRIKKLTYTGGPSGDLTLHRFFAATECPGPYLTSKMSELAQLVNDALDPPRFQSLDELPEWARPSILHLIQQGYLRGNSAGLDLSIDMVRILVVLNRALMEGGVSDES